jgi:hypothetical protein
LKALAPSTVLLAPHFAQATLAALSRLVGQLPIHEIRVGADVYDIPRAIEQFLSG